MLSVIIPAHNEEAVIGRLLRSLTSGPGAAELDIVVAANGCTDGTLDAVAAVPDVRVVTTPGASKPAALNAGDAAARHFPRAFVDADLDVDPAALLAVADALDATGCGVGAPAMRIDFAGCSWAVRSFYRVWTLLRWSTVAPVGGVYVLSAAGHARLGGFPDIISDDQYVHDFFAADERVCVREHHFTVHAPRTLRALIARRTRELEGQAEFDRRFRSLPGRTTGPGALELLREHPARVLDVALVAAVKGAAKWRLRQKRRRGGLVWERDDTSRLGVTS